MTTANAPRPKRVLLVGTDGVLCPALQLLLDTRGYSTAIVEPEQAVLFPIREAEVGLVILVGLPVASVRRELEAHLRGDEHSAPIPVLTLLGPGDVAGSEIDPGSHIYPAPIDAFLTTVASAFRSAEGGAPWR